MNAVVFLCLAYRSRPQLSRNARQRTSHRDRACLKDCRAGQDGHDAPLLNREKEGHRLLAVSREAFSRIITLSTAHRLLEGGAPVQKALIPRHGVA